ncbi:hypothetical protein GCM10009665_21530 [Kitasatospora nipponensis]|uniref:Phosphate transport system permease protein PstA n=2 Tax=Kitasatospora nipponensis TaxID=258049 RepID=A0ABP4GP95_9ACTN
MPAQRVEPPAATTVVPRPAAGAQALATAPRRRTGGQRPGDRYALWGSLAGSLAANALLFQRLAPFDGAIGFVICSWVTFLALYALVVSRDESGPAVRDRLAAAVVHSIAALLLGVLVWMVGYIFLQGFKALRHVNFYTQDLSITGPLDPLSHGGALHALAGTLCQITIALAITIPLGLICAIFLGEVPGRFATLVRTVVEAMTALPSVLAGLFVYAVVVLALDRPRSGFVAGVALSVMMLPILIRAADVVLRLVPASLKEASYALGASRWRTVWTVTLPSARSGLATAIILAAARGIGETSPVLLCSGYGKSLNLDLFHNPQASLPLMAFTLVKSPEPAQVARGFGAAALLLALVLLLFAVARALGGRAPGDLSRRQLARRARQSAADQVRMRQSAADQHRMRQSAADQAHLRPSSPPGTVRKETPVPSQRPRPRLFAFFTVLGILAASILLGSAPRAAADNYFRITGAGSTWSGNALDAWTSNVKQYGMTVEYDEQGSSYGRAQFKAGAVDFGVSEIPYGLTDQGQVDPKPSWDMAYLPIVAGGTSFMYNLRISGRQVTNLRLSPETLTKIFTGKITVWNDPAVQADNPGLKMPAIPVRPVVRSDGSGTTAQFTAWMADSQPALWNDYCGRSGRSAPCGFTSFYPLLPGSNWPALGTSVAVAKTVAEDANVGTITYVEYSYARGNNYPVVKLLNDAGYYVEPTGPSVSVALEKVQINPDLTQKLQAVYHNPDPRSYPLSSYSYMLVHTSTDGTTFTPAKGHTLAAFGYYFLCEGQNQADSLGYSPLTANLVESGFQQLAKIPGSEGRAFDRSKCSNPTFSADGHNPFADSAPTPPGCDKKGGATQCATGTGGARFDTPVSGGSTGAVTGGTTGGTGGTGAAASGGSGGGAASGGTGTGAKTTTGGTTGAKTATAGAATGTATGVGTGGTGAGTGAVGGTGGGSTGAQAGDGSGGGAAGTGGAVAGGTGGDPAPDPALAGDGSGGGTGGQGGAGAPRLTGDPVAIGAAAGSGLQHTLMVISALLLGAVIVLPPLLARRLSGRGDQR